LGWTIVESLIWESNLHTDDWVEAEAALAEATEVFDRSLSNAVAIVTRAVWGTLCLLQGRLADSRRLLAEANEKAEAVPVPARIESDRLHFAAQVAAAAGDWATAMDFFSASSEVLLRSGGRWWWARGLLDWAEAYASRSQPGDRVRAAELLREAQEAFQDMGVPRYAAITQERLHDLETAAG
jgi:hypothetical protein